MVPDVVIGDRLTVRVEVGDDMATDETVAFVVLHVGQESNPPDPIWVKLPESGDVAVRVDVATVVSFPLAETYVRFPSVQGVVELRVPKP